MFKTLFNALKVADLRKKLLVTLGLLIVFRAGAFITAPGVDGDTLSTIMAESSSSILTTINVVTGGAFSQLSIFAMSISPYITASIVIQLLTIAIPSLEELSKEGEAGRRKIGKYTKYLATVLGAVEAFGLYLTYRGAGVFLGEGLIVPMMFILTLTAGSTFLMWLADKITSKGVGNGTSLLIFAGIISGLPSAASYLWSLIMVDGVFSISGLLISLAVVIGAILLIAGVVWVTEAERRVPVQYAKRVVGRKMYGGQSTHIPIKLAMAGVMPVIFAMSLMQFPAMIIQLINPDVLSGTDFWAGLYKVCAFSSLAGSKDLWVYGIIHTVIYLALIALFTYFYTKMIFNTTEVANNLKKNGGFIPGIRAGKPTSDYLANILKYVSGFGSIFLGIIAVLPILVQFAGLQVSFGGTAILIVVSVALESIKQLESQMMVRHYKGFLD
ncbi:MAG: preprotein translocase subunit SecY [Clostridia bacterium]|nr:preprotein translocase subunit SecY [Clostridia bacterium]